jgi:translation initiation factor 4E
VFFHHQLTHLTLNFITAWVLWEHKAAGQVNKSSNWKENMTALCEYDTVENFWVYFNHLPKPSEVFFDGECRKKVGDRVIEEYSLFKKGIEPEWGEPDNILGGEWFCRQYFEPEHLDIYWQNLVMGVIGETIEDEKDRDHINGVRVLDKSRNYPTYKLEIWMNTRDPAIRNRIKDNLMDIITHGQLNRKTHPKFDWKDHS